MRPSQRRVAAARGDLAGPHFVARYIMVRILSDVRLVC